MAYQFVAGTVCGRVMDNLGKVRWIVKKDAKVIAYVYCLTSLLTIFQLYRGGQFYCYLKLLPTEQTSVQTWYCILYTIPNIAYRFLSKINKSQYLSAFLTAFLYKYT